MVFAALIGGIVGARLWSVIQNWDEAKDDLLGSLFSGTGLVFYGGLLGGAVAVLLWAKWRNDLGLWLPDLAAPSLAIAYAIGRLGCQLAGDGDYGIPTSLPWGMSYPDGTVPTTEDVHPTPIYEFLVMSGVAWYLWSRRDKMAPGGLFALYLVLAGTERFLVELIRRNEDVVGPFSLAQFVALASVAIGSIWLWRLRGTPAPAARPAPARLSYADPSDSHAAMAAPAVYPASSSAEGGRLAIGGCDAVALARAHGTPAFVMAEDDLRANARAFRTALATHHDGPGEVIFASKACPATAVLRVFAEEGLGVDVASGGELHLALKAGFEPARIYLHGNAKSAEELRLAVEAGVGTIVVDNLDDVAKLEGIVPAGTPPGRPRPHPPGRRRRHARRDPHGPRRVQVRHGPAPRAGARERPAGPPRRPRLPLPPRLPARRPDPVPRGGRRRRGPGRPPRLLARRRLRRGLHARRPAARDRRGGRRRGRGRPRGARPRQAPRARARAARSSPTRA